MNPRERIDWELERLDRWRSQVRLFIVTAVVGILAAFLLGCAGSAVRGPVEDTVVAEKSVPPPADADRPPADELKYILEASPFVYIKREGTIWVCSLYDAFSGVPARTLEECIAAAKEKAMERWREECRPCEGGNPFEEAARRAVESMGRAE